MCVIRRLSLILASLAAWLAVPALAQTAALTDTQARGAVAEVRAQVARQYFNDARRPAVLSALEAAERAGRYASRDAADLAAKLTEDLGRASSDQHMYIHWDPEQQRALAAAAQSKVGDPEDNDFNRARARERNHGLSQMRILPGNIRYLRLEGFLWDGAASEVAYDAAMRFLKDGDASIIDIRGNGGGSPDAVAYLVSHFVPPKTPLMRFLFAGGEERSAARDRLPAGRMIGKPLYVLIDGGVASAAEEFALHVEKLKLGELIGEKTAGAGNRNALVPVAPGFVLSLSVASAVHATDGKGWEATGIAPHRKIDPSLALEEAERQALTQLAETAKTPEAKGRYAWTLQGLNARLQPVKLQADELSRYAGQFGERKVELQAGGLVYQRADGPKLPLTPLASDLFQLGEEDSGVRLRFQRSGDRVGGIVVTYEDGRALAYARTS